MSGCTNYYNVANIDQTTIPRCKIFSLYEGGNPVGFYGNSSNCVLTAFLGFYPLSNPTGSGGGHLYINAAGKNLVYYGRIAAGGIDEIGGSPFNIPFCPAEPGSVNDRAAVDRAHKQHYR